MRQSAVSNVSRAPVLFFERIKCRHHVTVERKSHPHAQTRGFCLLQEITKNEQIYSLPSMGYVDF